MLSLPLSGTPVLHLPRAPLAQRAPWLAVVLAMTVAPAHAGSFTVNGTSTTGQTLGTGAGQTGLVTPGSSLTVSGSTVAVTISGNNATLTNLGTLSQTGTGRAVRATAAVTGLTITNGSTTNATALMQAANADVLQVSNAAASVTLHNYGRMASLNPLGDGNQAVDFNGIATGSNVVNNYASGVLWANEADAVRPGANGVVNNWGTIQSVTSTGSSSDGIDAQKNSGITVNNYATGVIDGARHGLTGEQSGAGITFTMMVNNDAGGLIRGSNGAGLNFDGVDAQQLVTVVNHGTITGNGVTGDGDGIDVDGTVNVTNTGIIRSLNSFSAVAAGLAYSEALSVGGGSIVNSGLIEGLVAAGNTNAVGRGVSLVGNDITSGPNAGQRESLYANATVINQSGGLIRGASDSALYAGGLTGSGKTVSIQNDAGATLRGGGTTSAAIVVASDYATTVHNAGLIDGSSSGKAIQLGSGNNTVTITGGQAQVKGDIDGGSGGHNTMQIDPGAGNTFAYDGTLSNFDHVTVQSGTVSLSGTSTYAGTTTIEAGGILVLDSVNRLSSASALELAGGTLRLQNASGANAQTFASLALSADSTIELHSGRLTFLALGSVNNGSQFTLTGADGSSFYAIRFAGDLSSNTAFQNLMAHTTVDGRMARYQFDGAFTNVTAVPEPQSYALMLAGLVAVGFMSRRRAPR